MNELSATVVAVVETVIEPENQEISVPVKKTRKVEQM